MIIATYTLGNMKDIRLSKCTTCRYKNKGCEMLGRHIDKVDECFMFSEKKVKKEGCK